ncbi:hypothetical protein BD324DRAFT_595477 [Kockovaella imperatae]|uniref:CP-type G domain-containing protein n=1 Tax=Kockovaella imperatae TaxID=4999 RepID=A0A1Y1U6M1_9TREE|nr:hypothetical protein BD324DRAFT_595477 [Kockovaella imperatae]ORX33681.1 hypothetical protein BD324DRAFT_595477 [Kockovaella imperatae]
MPGHRTKAGAAASAGLGKALINRKVRDAHAPKTSNLYVLDESNPLQSVTAERDLDEFLANAVLADTDFTTERSKARIISGPQKEQNPFLLSAEEQKKVTRKQADLRRDLHVPRRPPWTKQTRPEELERQERDSFLDWRRGIAELAETSNLLLTPFERNLQLWRQLWRVMERSHLLVQIVDARNPLGFRCVDLENYVQELGGGKKSLLLINKSDLLTPEQRLAWAEYFDKEGINYAFFSAAAASQKREIEEDDDEGSASSTDSAEEVAGLDDDEEGWSTDGEEEQAGPSTSVEQKSENGAASTTVLSVSELEDLFVSAAPPVPENEKLIIGLVGYPNVGKSSTINALLGEKKTSVSATPGKTKHFQTLLLTDRITLCDCPGLVFPQFANTQADMVVDGVLPIDQMREYSAPAELLCQRIPRDILEGTYGIRIDVRDEEDGGTGEVGWEEFLSAYAIARGMTRSSFGMPDTSRAARQVLKDYVNARLLYAHPPPGMASDEYMESSRQRTRQTLGKKKRAPVTHVGKNADTFVPPADAPALPTTRAVRGNAASAPGRTGKERSDALDGVFFNEGSYGVLTKGKGGGDPAARPMMYAQQRMLGPDGMPLPLDQQGFKPTGKAGKRHFKGREGKKRSGKGYD